MGYDAGIASSDKKLLEHIANCYRTKGEDFEFDADYALSHGVIYNVQGWVMRDVTRDVLAKSTGKETIKDDCGEDWEEDVVPVSVLREFTDAYDAFAKTDGGKRILACDRLEIDYMVGNADTGIDGEDPNAIVYVSPERMCEAQDALGSTGHLDALEHVLDECGRINNIAEMKEVLDWIDDYGAETVLWYESY